MSAGDVAIERTGDAEALLVQRAKARDPSAWAEIYDTHYKKLYSYCYARTSDANAAADLAASVFLEALSGIGRYEYRGRPLLAWLYRIAHNVVSDHRRKGERESRTLEQAAEMCAVLARRGIFAGSSSGAFVFAAIEYARREAPAVTATVLSDTGERYLSTGLWKQPA